VLTVKNNQPGLKRELKVLLWKDVPAISSVDTGHGGRGRRTGQAGGAPAPGRLPPAAPGVRIRRTRTVNKHNGGRRRRTTEVVHPVLLPSHNRRPARTGRLPSPGALDDRELPPPGSRRRHGRGPPPAAHRQHTFGPGHPAQPRHQPSSDSSTAPRPASSPPPESWPHALN